MAFAPELWLLVLGRAIAGITSANMAATAYITDISTEDRRAKRFGHFHALFGIGFIIGPVLGGILWCALRSCRPQCSMAAISRWRCSYYPNRARASAVPALA